jgi:ubiquinone/menaquinone biosynthesis C-methylase UbiE
MTKSGTAPTRTRICPWWLIHTFDNPLRRLLHNPDAILKGSVRAGDVCLDLGCGYGYFTIPMARLVGSTGTIIAADVQPEMLDGVRRRAEKSGVLGQIQLHRVDVSGLHFEKICDFALAFWMLHEVPDQEAVLVQIRASLKPGGLFLLVEPKGHVTKRAWSHTLGMAERVGFNEVAEPHVRASRAVLLITRAS